MSMKSRIIFSFLVLTSLLIGSLLGVLSLRTSSQAEAAQIHLRIRVRRPTPTSTLQPTSTPIPTPTPTATPSPTPTKAKPTSTPAPTSSPSIPDYLLNKVNDYRKSNGLPAVNSNSETCSFAATRAKEISTSFNHDGFTNRINNHTLPYASYHQITENIAMNSDYRGVVDQWINSPGHAENMKKDTPFVCIAKYGNYYAYEGWKP